MSSTDAMLYRLLSKWCVSEWAKFCARLPAPQYIARGSGALKTPHFSADPLIARLYAEARECHLAVRGAIAKSVT